MSLILYHTPRCPYADVARVVATRFGSEIESKQLSHHELSALPWGNYERSPILVDGPQVIEDWRAIVRYLDERFGDGALTAPAPDQRTKLFDLCEEIDKKILAPAALLLAEHRKNLLSQLLTLLPLQKLKARDRGVIQASMRAEFQQLRLRPEFTQPEFALARCLLESASKTLDSI
ncbi:MAG: hypothetical protein EBZ48_08775 [Proteobacteria bacterium]|nr:hypothetical protein [Pseudomonadota bacterium]